MVARRLARWSLAALSSLLLAAPAADAQLFRAYVASDGNDANPCTLPQPCRLLPAALNAVASGGEIWMLDSANYNTGNVWIAKSVSILAVPGALGSLVATGGSNAITVNTPGVKVSLRNLVVARMPTSTGSNGLEFIQGAALNVSDSEFAGFVHFAISAYAPASVVSVDRVAIRDSGGGIFVAGSPVTLTLSRSTISTPGGIAVEASSGSQATITDTVISGSAYGVMVFAPFGMATHATIANSTIHACSVGVHAETVGTGAVVRVSVLENAISRASTAVAVLQSAGSQVGVVVDGNKMTDNSIGFHWVSGTATIYSRGNNTLQFNDANFVGGGTLTPLAPA